MKELIDKDPDDEDANYIVYQYENFEEQEDLIIVQEFLENYTNLDNFFN